MARWFACRQCDEIVPWLAQVRYSVGLTDRVPRWMCAACLERLQQAEANYAAGYAFAPGDCVWAIEIVAEKGSRQAVTA